MSVNSISDLQTCLHSIAKLQKAIPANNSMRNTVGGTSTRLALVLPSFPVDQLRSALVHLNVRDQAITQLLQIFENRCQELSDAVQSRYRHALEILAQCDGGTQAYQRRFQFCLLTIFDEAVHAMKAETVKIVMEHHTDENIKTCRGDSRCSCCGDMDESSSRRGHTSMAVSILERAYAYTPNITQAEKYKLAEATGLQPRQVTIWVSVTAVFTMLWSCRFIDASMYACIYEQRADFSHSLGRNFGPLFVRPTKVSALRLDRVLATLCPLLCASPLTLFSFSPDCSSRISEIESRRSSNLGLTRSRSHKLRRSRTAPQQSGSQSTASSSDSESQPMALMWTV